MSRAVHIVLAAFILSILASCGGKPQQTSPKQADVVIWHWMTDRQETFEKLAAQYQQQTGTRVLFETYAPSEVYKNKIRAAATGKLLPEVFRPMGEKRELASFINSGYIADLTAAMDTGWKNEFFPKPLAQNTFEAGNEWNVKPGIYGVPIDVAAIEIFYNKDLLAKAGLDPDKPPKTWEEFIDAGRKLRAADIQPFVSGFGEPWLVSVFAQSYAWHLLGKQGIIDTYTGKIPYTDPRWVRVFSLFEEMRVNNMFASGIATMVNKDAERIFTTGRAAMSFNGSWAVNVYYTMNPNLDYGVIMPPVLSEAKYPMYISGGEGSSLNVNAHSANRDKAVAFLRWLTAKDQQVFLANETRNIPSNKNAADNLNPVLKQFADDIKNTFDPLPVSEDWHVSTVFNTGLQSIIIGEKSPAQVAQEVQAEKARNTRTTP